VFYNTYMNTVQFTSYLTWISSLIKPRVIDRYELHKVTKK
jgi:hypothetical protein